ncbi:DUF1735 domain-containing protein [Pedobacter petrophilus]|nr:DUF1735 domain-containing protein [Pedobacter petrophilus]
MPIYKQPSDFITNCKISNNRLLTLMLTVAISSLLSACSKEDRYDQQLISVKGNFNPISYLQKGNLIYLNGESYTKTTNFIGIPVLLTEKSKVADTIVATVDPSLIAEYNTQHGEQNPVFPEGAFGLSNNGRFPLAAGETQSKDSLFVTLKNGTGLKGQAVYLIPVRLASKNKGKILNEVLYFKMLLSSGNLTAFVDGASTGNGVFGGRIPGGSLSLVYFDYYPDSLKFNVGLNTALPDHDVIVEGTLLSETQLDSVKNAQYFFASPLPGGYATLSKSLSIIPKGQIAGQDSLVVRLSNKAQLERNQYYLLGIKLKHYRASKYGVPPVPGDSSVCYVRFFLY